MKVLSIRVDDEIKEQLETLAAESEVSLSDIVRAMVTGATSGGNWVVGYRDYGEHVSSVHRSEVEALRVVVNQGHGFVKFLPWGMTLQDLEREEREQRENAL